MRMVTKLAILLLHRQLWLWRRKNSYLETDTQIFFAKSNNNEGMITKLAFLPVDSAKNSCCENDLVRGPLGA